MTRWYALTEVPQPIRDTMATTWAKWEVLDITLDGILAMIHPDPLAAQRVGTFSRSVANRARVKVLCQIVHDTHGISWRATWRACGFFLGVGYGHVQRLFYGGSK